jgi:membrane protein required for colicin V production
MLDSMPVNPFDLAVLAVVLLSALIALWRGFVKEVLSLAAWAGAALVALWGFAYARPYARAFIDSQLLADAVAGIALFVVSLLIFAMIAHGIAALVRRSSALSAVDRSLGFAFGIARGGLLLGLGWLALAWAIPVEKQPTWLHESRTRPAVEWVADFLVGLAPPEFRGQVRQVGAEADRAGSALRALQGQGNQGGSSPSPRPNNSPGPGETGYKPDDAIGQLLRRTETPSTPQR